MLRKENLNDINDLSFPVLSSERYDKTMAETVLPYLDARKQSALFIRPEGFRLYCEYYKADTSEKGSVFISHGFSESISKYHEMIYYMLTMGYSVCIIDHRGHGYSRKADETEPDLNPTHIDYFQEYVNEVTYAVKNVLQKELKGPYYLYCHSMGGAVGALYAQQHPEVFKKIIFNAPMFDIKRAGIPYPIARLIVDIACAIGKSKQFMLGMTKYNHTEDFEHSADTCYERYLYYYKLQENDQMLQSSGPSFNWTRESLIADKILLKPANIAKIKSPVLLFQAEDDGFVLPKGHDLFMEKVKDGRYIFAPGTKHEIYYSDDETMKRYLHVIFEFLEQ